MWWRNITKDFTCKKGDAFNSIAPYILLEDWII